MMKSVVIGTAGHIDHGKSALVLALTGTDPDRLKEEKARGITIDLGFAHYEEDGINFAFVDVPGHERFVKNMLAGASGIDGVLLVVAADESVMPQTREHFEICRLLRVGGGVVALTKKDLVDEETLELARLETCELVAGSFLDGAPIVPVSAKTGQGLPALRAALARLAHGLPGRSAEGAARLPVDRAFSIRGFGTVVTGTLVSGRIRTDAELEVLPVGRRVKVRGVQVHGRKQPDASAGQRAAVNLGGIELAEIVRGDVLATPSCFEPTRRFDAVLELLADAKALRHGTRVRFHQGTIEVLGRVAIASPSAGTADAQAPGRAAGAWEVQPGGRAYVRLRLEGPAVLTRGDRFILRAYSPPVTIAGGVVLDPQPPKGAIRTAAGLARFRRLEPGGGDGQDAAASLDEAVAVLLAERGAGGLPLRMLTSRLGVAPDAVAQAVERLSRSRRAVACGDVLVGPEVLADLSARLLADLGAYHRTQPLSEGMPREEARERLFSRANPVLFDRVVNDLVEAGRITARDRLALGTHRVALSPDELRARDAIERAYRSGGLKPPDTAGLAATLGLDVALVDRILTLLMRQKVLVKIETLMFHADALRRLKEEIAALKAAGGPARIDVAAFKERYGITRKYAIPLLEYLDRERVTKRVGETRVIL